MNRMLLTALALLCFVRSGLAHDTWVQTNTNVVRTGDAVHIDLMLGNHGNDHRDFKLASKLSPELIRTFGVTAPDGKVYDLKKDMIDQGYGPKEGYYTARFVAAKPGVYVASQTLDKVLNKGKAIRAFRSAKTYFVVSDSLDSVPKDLKGFDKALGHRFELLAETNPVVPMGPGTPIRVKLLFDGKPLDGVKVTFVPRGMTLKEGADEAYERKTDKEGRAAFTPKEGNYYLVVAHLPREEKGEGYESAHYSATLNVFVPQTSVQESTAATLPSRLALSGLDPVLLVGGKEVKGGESNQTVRKGIRYLFATATNKATFEKEPERYEVQYDGHCAMSPSSKATLSVFTVYKGKIYTFYCTHCREAFLKKPEVYAKSPKVVAILVYNGVELLDFAGPGEVFSGVGHPFKVITVAADPRPVTSQGFVTITPNYSFADCPKVDFLVVPGGDALGAAEDPRLVKWVRKVSEEATVTLSVCTGAFLLAEAGLLDGKQATTHKDAIEEMKKRYPKVNVSRDKRFVDVGKIVTAAGVSAGIDGALHVVERTLGKAKADEIASGMEYRRDSRK